MNKRDFFKSLLLLPMAPFASMLPQAKPQPRRSVGWVPLKYWTDVEKLTLEQYRIYEAIDKAMDS